MVIERVPPPYRGFINGVEPYLSQDLPALILDFNGVLVAKHGNNDTAKLPLDLSLNHFDALKDKHFGCTYYVRRDAEQFILCAS